MYVHIGNSNIVNFKDVIGFFDYKILDESIEKKIINKNEFEESKIKSIVITEKNKEIKNYLSNISTITLQKRKV